MSVKRHLTKTCCGNKGYIFEVDKPVTKDMLSIFVTAGYLSSDVYTKVGVFYVERQGLTATGPFGGRMLQVRCRGNSNCSILLDHLENTFNSLV